MGNTLLFVFFALFFTPGLGALTLVPSENPVAVGKNVTISLNGPASITIGSWLFGPSTLFVWFPGDIISGSSHRDGISMDSTTYQLTLQSVTLNNSGVYALDALRPTAFKLEIALNVIVPISAVQVNPVNTPIEGMPFSLSCNVVGPVKSIQWMKNSQYLSAGNNISFSSDNSTLFFSQLALSNEGLYACAASNPVSSMTSLDYNLLANYGPYSVQASGPSVIAAGTSANFSCSADSRPECQFSWWFGGSKVGDGAVFVTAALSETNSGLYTCVAFNSITGKNSSASVTLTVLVPVSNVVVSANKQLPIFNQTFSLTCQASGNVQQFNWMKNGVYVTNGSGVLNFTALSLSDDGLYECEASNVVSRNISQAFDLKIIYGPWNTSISGPTLGAVGSNVTFFCSADSYPGSQFTWWFNSSQVGSGPMYETTVFSSNSSGLYICEAVNNITNLMSSASLDFTAMYPVSNVIVNVGSQLPILGQPFQLTCSASGFVEHIQWTNNNTLIYPGNGISFSSDNSTLSIQNITLSYNGYYACEASNAVSNVSSPTYDLMVNYGPWSTTITGPSIAETGVSVNFSCSASSYPESQYSWWFNGSQVGTGPLYVTGPLLLNNTGLYTCEAVNNITGYNSSVSLELTVVDAITTVHVISEQLIPLANQPLQLRGKVNGPYHSLHWLYNNQILQPSARVNISADNSTVSFSPLVTADNGKYQCVATNALKQHTSQPYDLMAVFGPNTPSISFQAGLPSFLICDAPSYPPAMYEWILPNNAVVGNQPIFKLPIEFILGCNYTCVASNPLTNVTAYKSYVISYNSAAVNAQASVVLPAFVAFLLPVLREYL